MPMLMLLSVPESWLTDVQIATKIGKIGGSSSLNFQEFPSKLIPINSLLCCGFKWALKTHVHPLAFNGKGLVVVFVNWFYCIMF